MLEDVPAGHARQVLLEVAAGSSEKYPAGHFLQLSLDGDPNIPENVPAGHPMQDEMEICPTSSEYAPTGHFIQPSTDDNCVRNEKVPAGHGVQDWLCDELENVPIGHDEHEATVPFTPEKKPGLHGLHESLD